MLRLSLRLKLGAAAALLFFTAALVVVGLAAWRQEALHQYMLGDVSWHAHKLDRDIVQLRSDLVSQTSNVDTLAELRLRFDLIYSRTNLLQRGDIHAQLVQMPQVKQRLPELILHLEQLDVLLDEIERLGQGERWVVSDRLERIASFTEQFIIDTNGYLADSATRDREVLQTLYAVLLALILAMSLAALMVVASLVREARDNAEARRSLELLSRELQSTAQRAEAASQAKSQFLATVSHEIRTPLNGVIGMSDLLMEQPSEAQTREFVRTLHLSATRLMDLINDILDFSKVEAGRLELERRPIRLAALVEESCRLFLPHAQSKGLRLEGHISTELPEHCLGDPARLRQVLLNLIANAIKFTEQGEVRVAATRSGKGRLCLAVHDTGPGIEAAKQEQLFEPFRQGDASTTRRYGGTGLGLAISRRLAEAMGGVLGVESEFGQGSRFWIELPLEAVKYAEPELLDLPLSPRAVGGRVLLVEDNPVNQQVAVAMLERYGCSVQVAESGQKALTIAAQERFDIIFMDVQLPDMDGLETTRRLRQMHDWGAVVPIIAMTAGGPGAERERCLAAGMRGYLTKPLRLPALGTLLRQSLGGALAAEEGEHKTAPELIDEGALEALAETLEPDALAALIQLHGKQLRESLQALERAFTQGDLAQVASIAHRIKGESGSLGGQRLVAAARKLEQMACSGEAHHKLLAELAVLRECVPATLKYLECWQERLGAS